MDIKTRWKRTKGTRLLSTEGTFLPLPPPSKDLTLEISASPDTWRALYIMSFAKPEDLVSMIRNLSKTTFDYISAKPGREDFVDKMKRYAAYVYCWAEYWLKKPQDEWPEPLKELVRQLSKYSISWKERKAQSTKGNGLYYGNGFWKRKRKTSPKKMDKRS